MERRKEQPVDDVVALCIREMGLETPLLEYRITQAWPSVVGEAWASMTQTIEVRAGVLWVGVHSPALLAELQMRHTDLAKELNTSVRANIITDVKFRLINEMMK